MNWEPVRAWDGWILGYKEPTGNGDITYRAFSGVILGFYKKELDVTTNFQGIHLTKGDTGVSLIMENAVMDPTLCSHVKTK